MSQVRYVACEKARASELADRLLKAGVAPGSSAIFYGSLGPDQISSVEWVGMPPPPTVRKCLRPLRTHRGRRGRPPLGRVLQPRHLCWVELHARPCCVPRASLMGVIEKRANA